MYIQKAAEIANAAESIAEKKIWKMGLLCQYWDTIPTFRLCKIMAKEISLSTFIKKSVGSRTESAWENLDTFLHVHFLEP